MLTSAISLHFHVKTIVKNQRTQIGVHVMDSGLLLFYVLVHFIFLDWCLKKVYNTM